MFNLKKKTVTEDAQHIIGIVEEYSNKKYIQKLMSPISDEYFLIDSENEISICIGDEHVTLSNHIFLYKLKKTVKENMEKEMQLLKQSLFNNETNLLSNVLKLASNKEDIKKAS